MENIIIIGCGVVGATIAYELSRDPRLHITVVDKQEPARGSSGAALGVLMGVVSQRIKGRAWQSRQASLQRYETLVPELEAITGSSIPYNRHGLVILGTESTDKDKWAALAEVRQSQGWQLKLWQPETLEQHCPQVNLAGLWGAVYSPSDRQIDPLALTTALVAAAQKNGVEFHFGIEINHLDDLHNLENLGNLGYKKSDRIILATALGTTKLTTNIGTPIDIRPVLGQAMQLELPAGLGNPEFQPVISGGDIHIVPIANHNYWIGATVEFADEQGELWGNQELLETMRTSVINFCPDLAQGKVVKTWSGLRPRPEGQPAPVLKKLPNYEHIILATGHYRNGVLLAPATAIAVLELLRGEC